MFPADTEPIQRIFQFLNDIQTGYVLLSASEQRYVYISPIPYTSETIPIIFSKKRNQTGQLRQAFDRYHEFNRRDGMGSLTEQVVWTNHQFEQNAHEYKDRSMIHPNRLLSCRRVFRRRGRDPGTWNESMQTVHTQVRTGSIPGTSVAYGRFGNEMRNKERRMINVRTTMRFGSIAQSAS